MHLDKLNASPFFFFLEEVHFCVVVIIQQYTLNYGAAHSASCWCVKWSTCQSRNPWDTTLFSQADFLRQTEGLQNIPTELCKIFWFTVIKGSDKAAVAEEDVVNYQCKDQKSLPQHHPSHYCERSASISLLNPPFDKIIICLTKYLLWASP